MFEGFQGCTIGTQWELSGKIIWIDFHFNEHKPNLAWVTILEPAENKLLVLVKKIIWVG